MQVRGEGPPIRTARLSPKLWRILEHRGFDRRSVRSKQNLGSLLPMHAEALVQT